MIYYSCMSQKKKLTCFVWMLLILTGIFSVSFPFASAAVDTENQAMLKDRQDRLNQIKLKIKAYQEIIGLKQRQGITLQSQIESLEAQAAKLELEIGQNQGRIEQLSSDIDSLTQRITEKEERILMERNLLTELIRDASGVTHMGLARLLTVTDDAANLTLKSEEWTMQMSHRLNTVLDDIRIAKEEIEHEHILLSAKKSEADTLQEQLDKQSDYLDSTKSSKATLLVKTQTEMKKYNTVVDQLQDEKDAIENEIESLESSKVSELNLKDMPAFKHGLLKYPVKSTVFSQGYGKTAFAKKSKFYGKSGFHNGLDFAMPVGTKILAAADGKVIATGNNGRYAYGRWMAIDHGNGIVTMYGHLSAYTKSRGDTVRSGDTIAKSGNTGNSTGPHLHFTIFSAKSFEVVPSKSVASVRDIPIGATVNPKNYLP